MIIADQVIAMISKSSRLVYQHLVEGRKQLPEQLVATLQALTVDLQGDPLGGRIHPDGRCFHDPLTYLPFSPMTDHRFADLARHWQIAIYRHRRLLRTVAGILFGCCRRSRSSASARVNQTTRIGAQYRHRLDSVTYYGL